MVDLARAQRRAGRWLGLALRLPAFLLAGLALYWAFVLAALTGRVNLLRRRGRNDLQSMCVLPVLHRLLARRRAGLVAVRARVPAHAQRLPACAGLGGYACRLGMGACTHSLKWCRGTMIPLHGPHRVHALRPGDGWAALLGGRV